MSLDEARLLRLAIEPFKGTVHGVGDVQRAYVTSDLVTIVVAAGTPHATQLRTKFLVVPTTVFGVLLGTRMHHALGASIDYARSRYWYHPRLQSHRSSETVASIPLRTMQRT
jgi:hypothetical protein